MDSKYNHAYLYVDDVKAHYIEAGEGAPLVLIHGRGAGSSGEANYGDVIGPLGKHFHAIAPDVIGYGYTTPRSIQDGNGQAEGNFLVKFLEKLDVGPVYLGGNSHGGFLSQYVAHERPDLVKRLIIINSLNGTSPYPPLPEGKNYIYGPGGHQARKPDLESMLTSAKEGKRRFFAHQDLVTEERVKRSYEIILRNYKFADERGRANSSTTEDAVRDLSYKGKHISEWASDLKMPVLLTWSEPGSKIEWGVSHFFKINGCEMHLFPWSGHHVQTDQRDRWTQVVTNWLQNETARPLNEPREPIKRRWEDSYVDVDGVKTHYIQAGKGDTFILCHGMGPWGGLSWSPAVNLLSENFHTVAPDLIGYGYTPARGSKDLPGRAEGEFLIRFIESLDVGPVALAGHSHGGFITQYVAHERPDLIKRLILTNSLNGTSPIPPLPEGSKYICGPGGHEWQNPTIEQTKEQLKNYYTHEELSDEMVNDIHGKILTSYEFVRTRGETVFYSVEASNANQSYKGKHISEWASDLKMPVFLIWSEPGSKIEWALSHFFKIPGCEAHFLPWSGHTLHKDQVERWVQVATNWLKNDTARPPN